MKMKKGPSRSLAKSQTAQLVLSVALVVSLVLPSFALPGRASATGAAPSDWSFNERVNVSSNNADADGWGDHPKISANGRYVVFESTASNIVPNGDGVNQIYLHDRKTGETELVSRNAAGEMGNMYANNPSVSDDGRYVVFNTKSTNLVDVTNGIDPNAAENFERVYLYDRTTHSTHLISVSSDGTPGDQYSQQAVISSDGNWVAFWSESGNLTPESQPYKWNVYMHNTQTGATQIVKNDLGGTTDTVESPAISSDGAYVAFTSSDALVPEDTNGVDDVYLYSKASNSFTLVSQTATHAAGNAISSAPSISADGQRVVFTSESSDLVTGDTNGVSDVFLFDLADSSVSRVSLTDDGQEPDSKSLMGAISPDGQQVAFASHGLNMMATGIPVNLNLMSDPSVVYVQNLATHQVQLGSRPMEGLLTGAITAPALSNNGALVFRSDSQALAPLTNPNVNYSYGAIYVAQNQSALPTWPADSKLTASNVTDIGLTLHWPALVGQNVTGYKIFSTNTHQELIGFVDENTTSFDVIGQNADLMARGYQVEAVNGNFQTSWGTGPKLSKNWDDSVAPTWPSTPMLGHNDTNGYIELSIFPYAEDNTGVAGYRLYRIDPDTQAETLVQDNQFAEFSFMAGELPAGDYVFVAKAYDSAGNESVPTPPETVHVEGTNMQTGQLSASPIAGGYHLAWSPGGNTVTNYDIMDVTPGEAPTVLQGLITAPATSFDLVTPLAPGARMLQVNGRNNQGQLVYQTNSVEVQSDSNNYPLSITVSRGGNVGDTLQMGAQLEVTVHGAPNSPVTLTATRNMWDTTVKPYQKTSDTFPVVMQESSQPGVYNGTLVVPGNTAAITGLTAIQADPNGGAPQTYTLPNVSWPVYAEWDASVSIPAEMQRPLHDKLVLTSQKAGIFQTKTLNDSGQLTFGRLPESDDYTWMLVDNLGRKVKSADAPFQIYAGLKQATAIDVKVTTVKVKLTEADGVTPIPNTMLNLTDPATQTLLGTRVTDANGEIPIEVLKNQTQDSLAITAWLDESIYQRFGTQQFSLNLGQANVLNIQAHALTRGTIAGQVKSLTGEPIPGAIITVSQTVGGRDFSKSVKTDANGEYSVYALEGKAKVLVSLPANYLYAFDTVEVTVAESQTTTANFSLEAKRVAVIKLNLYTKYADGDWQGPMPIDWTVGVHLHLSVDGMYTWSASNPLLVPGRVPGDTVQICMDGSEGGLSKACTNAVVDSNMEGTAELRLQQQETQILGRLQLPTGAGNPDSWMASLYKDGTLLEYHNGSGSLLKFTTPSSGLLKLFVSAKGKDWNHFYSKSMDFNVQQGAAFDIGTMALQTEGVFSGRDGNSLQSSALQLSPGQTGTLRVAYKATQNVQNARLVLNLGGATAVPGTVLINNAPAAAESVDTTSKPGSVAVKLGNLNKDQSGIVRVSFQVPSSFAEPQLLADAHIDFTGTADEMIGTVQISTAPITFTAPARTTSLSWTVSGTAPAGHEVSICSGSQLLGKTVASPGGVWTANVTAADPQGEYVFGLQAFTTDMNGQMVHSPLVKVDYDPDTPALQELTMRQGDGRVITLDVTKGVPHFPYVVRPWEGFYFDLKFNKPSEVTNVKVHLGSGPNETVGNAVLKDNGMWHVEMTGSNSSQVGEGIFVTFDRKPQARKPVTQVPTEQEVRAQLPPGMRDVTFENKEMLHTEGNVTSGHLDMTLPNSDLGLGVDLSMEDNVKYTPTAEEVQAAAASGIPVYQLQFDTQIDPDTNEPVTVVSGYVEKSQKLTAQNAFGLLTASLDRTPTPATAAPKFAAVGGQIVDAVKITGKIVWHEKTALYKGGSDIQQAKQNVDGRFDVNKKFDQIVDLAQRANSCPQGTVWNSSIEFANNMIIAGEVTKWALNITGAVLAPETLGAALVLNVAGNWLQAKVDEAVDKRLKSLDDHISAMGECGKPKDADGEVKTPTASPVWIYDPSGFVYETFQDNPVEDVKATVYYLDADTSQWQPWDAEWFDQVNPQMTDPQGKYGWDVPQGKWKVVYEKAGYEVAQSDAMDVPPPQFNVNIPMVSYQAPQITVASAATANSGTVIEFTTDKYVRTTNLTTNSVTVTVNGSAVVGTLTPLDARTDDQNVSLSKSFRFSTAQKIQSGTTVTASLLASDVVSYAGVAAVADDGQDTITQTVQVQTADETAPTLMNAATGANGNVVTLTFNESLNTGKALDSKRFSLQGTTVTPRSLEYGPDGQTVKLFLSGPVPVSGVKVSLTAGAVEDKAHNGSATVARAITNQAVSDDASLQSIALSGVPYSQTPAFSPDTLSYTMKVPDGTKSVNVQAIPANSGASMRLEGGTLAANQDASVALSDTGETVVLLGVTAADQLTTRQYELHISHGYVTPSGGGGADTPSPDGVLTLDDVKKGLDHSVLTLEQSTPTLSGDAWAYLKQQNASLVLKQPNGTVTLLSSAFGDQIEKQLGVLDSTVTLSFAWGAVEDQTSNVWFKTATERDKAYSVASKASQLFVSASLGSKKVTLNPEMDLLVSLPLSQAIDARKVGVYQYDAQAGQWTYVRSKLDQGAGVVTVHVASSQPIALLAYDKRFTDVTDHWARTSIEHLAAHHVITGDTETTYLPEGLITRAEFVALVDRLVGLPTPIKQVAFSDVSSGDWYANSVSRAAAAGITNGLGDGTFQPNGQITREQMVVMIVGALKANGSLASLSADEQAKLLEPFSDAGTISDWAREAFAQAIHLHLISGVSATELAAQNLLTRAEAASILDRYPVQSL